MINLPNEFLCAILDLLNPQDFESLALTCKHFYEIGKPLFRGHNRCKDWQVDLRKRRSSIRVNGIVCLDNPFFFLDKILQFDLRMQPTLLQNRFTIYLSYASTDFE
jgi:hypothetical protein